ncbi:MAG: hypothetical protein H7Y32_03985, partial [Chloroflexales bacterium]|nr:hypothetical protein [Chloroflexales bacterium]
PSGLPEPPFDSAYGAPAQPLQVLLRFAVQGKRASIGWRSEAFGEERTTAFKMPYAAATLPAVIKALDSIQLPSHQEIRAGEPSAGEQAALMPLGLWADGRVPPDAYRIVGRALYKGLGREGAATLEAARNYAIERGLGVNYALRFPRTAQDLTALPWELLSNNDGLILFKGGRDLDSCERYFDSDRPIPPPITGVGKPHLLALLPTANLDASTIEGERAARRATWDKLRDAGRITYHELSPLTPEALVNYMNSVSRPPDIVHFFGHATDEDGGALLFDDENNGSVKVSPTRLAMLFGGVRLLVVMGDRSPGLASALSEVTDASIMTQLATTIQMATDFTRIFYNELLAKCRSLQESVAEARQLMFFKNEHVDWYVPVLYIRSREPRPVYLVQ